MNKTGHNIVAYGLNGGHNGEYYYKCTKCGASDWIPAHGRTYELNFYSKPCTPEVAIPELDYKTAYTLLQEQHTRDISDKHNYIDMLGKRHRAELNEKDSIIKSLKEKIELLHYTVKGACAEHMSIRMQISPSMLASENEKEITRYMTERANKQMAHAVEKQLGDRYELIKEHDRAMRHIYYLENHARSRGLSFTEFGMPLKFR